MADTEDPWGHLHTAACGTELIIEILSGESDVTLDYGRVEELRDYLTVWLDEPLVVPPRPGIDL